ncbi:3'(2'),5'-bisphosphate nucleotidase CysQ [Rhizobium cremeum]|uniref:3'(2'),5'-bisphosphate nucleotidase CysQ n=1 Tax=Rhizobium cremeum TaxID=2813827 RepID=UPI0039E18282
MLEIFEKAALDAGRAIMEICRAGPEVRMKPDHSPVTEADECAERIILAELSESLGAIPVVAEESAAAGHIPETAGRFLLVDPLDGTREFVGGHCDFTVNIALIEAGRPVAGFVYAPALGVAYAGSAEGAFKLTVDEDFRVSERKTIASRIAPASPKALISRSHNSPATLEYLEANDIADRSVVGSSLKFCLLAEGSADLYPRFGYTMEWDTAAGDAILRAAGGITLTLDGLPLSYGKRGRPDLRDFANPDFIAWGKRS